MGTPTGAFRKPLVFFAVSAFLHFCLVVMPVGAPPHLAYFAMARAFVFLTCILYFLGRPLSFGPLKFFSGTILISAATWLIWVSDMERFLPAPPRHPLEEPVYMRAPFWIISGGETFAETAWLFAISLVGAWLFGLMERRKMTAAPKPPTPPAGSHRWLEGVRRPETVLLVLAAVAISYIVATIVTGIWSADLPGAGPR